MSRIGKSTETESRLVVARDKEDEGMGRRVDRSYRERKAWQEVTHKLLLSLKLEKTYN